MKLTRRELVEHLKNIVCAAGAYQLLPSSLQAQTPSNDEHFFIFVELKGGVHHLISTDYPDPDELNKIDPDGREGIVMRFAPKDKPGFLADPDLPDNFKNIFSKSSDPSLLTPTPAFMQNGYFTALPYNQKPEDGLLSGPTHQGKYQYRLGLAGLPLANYTNDISVLRGVYMLGDFHTQAGREIFSGKDKEGGTHLAGVLAKLLEDKYGEKPLDNLVFEGANYPSGRGNFSSAEVKLSFDLLGALAEYYSGASAGGTSPSLTITRALQKNLAFSPAQDITIEKYMEVMQGVETMKSRLGQLIAKDEDISLQLGMQLNTCLELFKSNISRVITICVGEKNLTNNTDGFGLFDSHSGLYHQMQGNRAGSASSRHHKILEGTLNDLAEFIEKLKTTDYKEGKKWSEVVTLVLSSEFGRPANFFGDESVTRGVGSSFGNGHYNFNNNYVFFGKNIRQGVWLGESDPITRFPFVVDFAKLNAGGSKREIFTKTVAKTSGGQMKMMEDFQGTDTLNPDMNNPLGGTQVPRRKDKPEQRAFMSVDVVKTLMAVAGVSSEDFHQKYYAEDSFKDAKIIAPLLR